MLLGLLPLTHDEKNPGVRFSHDPYFICLIELFPYSFSKRISNQNSVILHELILAKNVIYHGFGKMKENLLTIQIFDFEK